MTESSIARSKVAFMPLDRTLDRMVKRKRCASANLAVADKAELFTTKLAETLHDQALAPAQVRLLASCSL